tara:strand:- start:305 stop:1375 length:1071 start_codon:yes stop_codon:yes gene_type:complete
MSRQLNNKHSYYFWITRYSLIQIGIYCIAFLSYILYLLPVVNNDSTLYSYLISSITLVRLRTYLNDVVAFIPRNKNINNSTFLVKKIIIYLSIGIINVLIYQNLGKVNFITALLITFPLMISVYIAYLNNYDLHNLIRENSISKVNLFLFGFFPRFISFILLIIYIFFIGYKDPYKDFISYIMIISFYILPSALYRVIFLKKLTAKRIYKKVQLTSKNIPSYINFYRSIKFLEAPNLNLASQILLNFSFFIIMLKMYPLLEGNIFKLPISISLLLNFILLASRVIIAKKYTIENRINGLNHNFSSLFFIFSIIVFVISKYSNTFNMLYGLALFAYLLNVIIIHFDKEINLALIKEN